MLLKFKIKEKNWYKISAEETKLTHGKNSWKTGKYQSQNQKLSQFLSRNVLAVNAKWLCSHAQTLGFVQNYTKP